MQNANKVIGGIAIIALLLGLWGVFGSHSAPAASSSSFGSAIGVTGGSAGAGTLSPLSSTTQSFYVYPNPTNFDYVRGNALEADQLFLRGGYSVTNSVAETQTIGSCASGGSSTLFAVASPLNATSTAKVLIMTVGGNATTSSLLVGTSTKSTSLVSTDVSPSFINSTNGISSSTVFTTASGVRQSAAPNLDWIDAGSGSQATLYVIPGQYVVAYSTTTATGAGAAQYAPGFTTCTYKIIWTE